MRVFPSSSEGGVQPGQALAHLSSLSSLPCHRHPPCPTLLRPLILCPPVPFLPAPVSLATLLCVLPAARFPFRCLPICPPRPLGYLNDYAGPASVYDGDAEAALLKGPSPEPMYAEIGRAHV